MQGGEGGQTGPGRSEGRPHPTAERVQDSSQSEFVAFSHSWQKGVVDHILVSGPGR